MLQQLIALMEGLTPEIYAATPLYRRQQFVDLCDQWAKKARELEADAIVSDAREATTGLGHDLRMALAKGGAHEA